MVFSFLDKTKPQATGTIHSVGRNIQQTQTKLLTIFIDFFDVINNSNFLIFCG